MGQIDNLKNLIGEFLRGGEPLRSPIPGYKSQNIKKPIAKKEIMNAESENYRLNKDQTINDYFSTLTPTPSPNISRENTPTPTPTIEALMKVIASNKKPTGDYIEDEVLPRTRRYGIPDALAAGQWAGEGRFINPENNNLYNLMYDGKLHKYQNLDTNIADYALTVKNILKRQGKDLKDVQDAMDVLKLLQSGKTRFEGHNPDPNTYIDLVSSTPEFKKYYKK